MPLGRIPSNRKEQGFVLALTILLILGVTAISVGTMYNGKMGRMSANNYKNKIVNFTAADGLMTLLAQELINGNGGKYVDATKFGRIKGDVWVGMPGNTLAPLKQAIANNTPPNYHTSYSKYLGNQVSHVDYGVRWSGWLVPPLSGPYTFITRSDDASEFFLSTDATKGNLSSAPACSL